MRNQIDYKSFYDERRNITYAHHYADMKAANHHHYNTLKNFIVKYNLDNKICLEIGSSGGMFQDMVKHYYGTDIAQSLEPYYHKIYRVAQDDRYPFDDEFFDAIWTITVYEHIPHLQQAMLEIKRLLKPGGVVLFGAAWQCRPWTAQGYTVRPYSDFGLKGKLVKVSIPLRDSVIWRSMFVFPKRLFRHACFCFGHKYRQIKYKTIQPNYEIYWCSDSDACNHIDLHDAILWFESNQFTYLSHPLHLRASFVKTGCLVFRKNR